jgi:hypothetical protein
MAAPITPSAPVTARRPKLIQHPSRVATVIAALALVVTLGVVLLQSANTDTASERRYPTAIDGVSPGPGELIRAQDTISADLRDGLTGVILLKAPGEPTYLEIPEDQLERIGPLGQLSFRTDAEHEFAKFAPGEWGALVLFWPQGKERPVTPGQYSWAFRVGA